MAQQKIEFRPQKKQEAFLSSSADIAIFGGSAGGGKMISIDTPIPTPSGWVANGDLQAGDEVFTETGAVCKVLQVHPITTPERAYRLTFDDGSTVDACSEHLWLTYDANELSALTKRTDEYRAKRRARRASRANVSTSDKFQEAIASHNKALGEARRLPLPSGTVRNTQQIADTLTVRGERANHAVPVCKPLQLPERELPLDPYLLGVWLGDGTRGAGGITTPDAEVIMAFRDGGFHVNKLKADYGWWVHGLITVLKTMGVERDKHIPAEYLRASYGQRLALLQGLMDSDGYCDPDKGSAEYTTVTPRLAQDVVELIRSLGTKAAVKTGEAKLNGRCTGPKYRITFSASYPIFRLERKLKSQRLDNHRRTIYFRYIKSCERIDPVPMRCITVSNPTGLYLCGSAFIPTHNTFSMLLEPLRHLDNGKFGAVFFRRTYPEITSEGGLWDDSEQIYPYFGGKPVEGNLYWRFPSGMKISFAHMQYEKTLQDYQGAQIPLILFDQLEHFTEKMFFYMLSRNRSMSGVHGYMRATCNPEPGWLADFLDWWIDEDGYANMSRAGVVRWFVRGAAEQLIWADTLAELKEQYPDQDPLSVTFIPATIYDNPILLEKDPGYLANLQALPLVDRMRLLGDRERGGNWKIKPSAGKVFNRSWFKIVNAVPSGGVAVRRWDFAATEKELNKSDPDFTASCLMLAVKGSYYILDVTAEQLDPAYIDATYENITRQDYERLTRAGVEYMSRWEQEPGSAGKRESYRMTVKMAGVNAKGIASRLDKLVRAKPLAAQAEAGNVYLLAGAWNELFIEHMHGQPELPHDDIMDASSGAFSDLVGDSDYTLSTAPNPFYT